MVVVVRGVVDAPIPTARAPVTVGRCPLRLNAGAASHDLSALPVHIVWYFESRDQSNKTRAEVYRLILLGFALDAAAHVCVSH